MTGHQIKVEEPANHLPGAVTPAHFPASAGILIKTSEPAQAKQGLHGTYV
jgi:hypothetical protein